MLAPDVFCQRGPGMPGVLTLVQEIALFSVPQLRVEHCVFTGHLRVMKGRYKPQCC